jgi:iron(III) transport system permease protein
MERIFLVLILVLFAAPLVALVREGYYAFSANTPAELASLFDQYGPSSFLLLSGSVLGAIFFGGGSAYLCARFNFPLRRALLWLSLLPLAVPSYLVAYSWLDLLVGLGVPGGKIRTLPATCFIFAVCLSPYVFLPTYGSLSSISNSILESSQIVLKSRFKIFWRVEFPLVRGSLFAGAILAGMEVLADFGTVDFMAVDTWSTGIYRSWFGYNMREHAALLALILFLLSGTLLSLESSLLARRSISPNTRERILAKPTWLNATKALPLVTVFLLPFAFSTLVPVCYLLYQSTTATHLDYWLNAFPPLLNTLTLATSASCLVVLIAFTLSHALRSIPSRPIKFLARFCSLGYAIPGGVLGVAILMILAPLSLAGSLLGVIIAYAIRFATVGTSTLHAGWRRIPKTYEEQGWLLRFSTWKVFWRITLPLLKTNLACAFVLTAIDIVKELPATMLLRPFNFETLAIKTYNLASDERLRETAPTSLAMVVLCFSGVIIAQKLGAFSTSSEQNRETPSPQRGTLW